MIWYLPLPVAAWFMYRAAALTSHSFSDWVPSILASALGLFLMALLATGISRLIGKLPPVTGRLDRKYPLVALREKDGATGAFFLGSGLIDGSQYYVWYRRNGDGSISGGRTRRDPDVRIYEEEGAKPEMLTYRSTYTWGDWVSRLWWIVGLDHRDKASWWPDFVIPPGSVREGYEL